MADIEYFEDEGVGSSCGQGGQPAKGPSQMGTIVNWAGAVVSLGLVVGMGVWAYQLTMRDVSGVPVVRALEGPMRVAPAEPGGIQAEHQGLAVNRIAEGEEAAPVPDRLVLAPPPVDLAGVELASASTSATVVATESTEADSAAAGTQETQELIERLLQQATPLEGPELTAPALSDSDAAAAEPRPAPATEAAAATAEPSASVIAASVPGVVRSPVPAARPAVIMARAEAPVSAQPAPTPEDTAEIDPSSLPAGTRLVQLGAFDTPEIARTEWTRLTARFPDFFDGRSRVIEPASSGGSEFYRLRAHGFADLAASRRFCAALMAQNAACIPVTVR